MLLRVVQLVAHQQQVDGARVGRQTAHDVRQRAERQHARLLHEQRVLVRRLGAVRRVACDVIPQPVEATRLALVPHYKPNGQHCDQSTK